MSNGKSLAYVANASKEQLKLQTIDLPPLDDDGVEIKVRYCGVCHSDVHMLLEEWGSLTYPFIPGHEIMGEITAVGSRVTTLNVGDTVGVGWQKSSCGQCEYCESGNPHLCQLKEATVGFGGFAQYHRTKARFAFLIPEELKNKPPTCCLLCAGVTVFTPFLENDVKPIHRVAVIGMGGLGHLGLLWAKYFGCEVAAFSTSADKEADAKKLGAHKFIVYDGKNPAVARKASSQLSDYFDFILVTAPHEIPTDWLVSMLRRTGKICYVASSKITIDASNLFMERRSAISGSNTGSPTQIKSMLEFAARHNIQPWAEIMPIDQVNEAVERVRANKAKFRIVLDLTKIDQKK